MELNQLRRRARRHNLRIITDRNTGLYYLADIDTDCVAAPGPMNLGSVEAWIDDLDRGEEEGAE